MCQDADGSQSSSYLTSQVHHLLHAVVKQSRRFNCSDPCKLLLLCAVLNVAVQDRTPLSVISTGFSGVPHFFLVFAARSSPSIEPNRFNACEQQDVNPSARSLSSEKGHGNGGLTRVRTKRRSFTGLNVGMLVILETTSIPSTTLPNTTLLPSSCVAGPGPVLVVFVRLGQMWRAQACMKTCLCLA